MCETCNLLTIMYTKIDNVDSNLRTALVDMIYETAQQIPQAEKYNVAYHKVIGSTPSEGMPHSRMPIIEDAIRAFCTQNDLRLD